MLEGITMYDTISHVLTSCPRIEIAKYFITMYDTISHVLTAVQRDWVLPVETRQIFVGPA